MGSATDRLFLDIALRSGCLDEARAQELERTAGRLRDMGMGSSYRRVAREMRFLTEEQVEAIRREMRRHRVPARLGPYEIVDRLAAGAMGIVYRARHQALGRVVALKVLRRGLARDPRYVERFRREAGIAARIVHPNAVHIFAVGEQDGRHFMAMELVEGPSAADLIREAPLDERRGLEIARGVASALAVAHREGIIHRDIKPSNILLAGGETPKLADLGLARDLGASGEALTRAGAAVGTLLYMSPEQCMGLRDLDGRADIYALGATLYHLLCGRPPYDATHPGALWLQHVNAPTPDPRRARPDLSRGAAELIRKMMAKDRRQRPATAEAVIADIDRVLRGERPAPSAALRHRRPRPAFLVGAAALLAVATLVAALAGRRPSVTPTSPPVGAPAAAKPQTAPAPVSAAAETPPPAAPQPSRPDPALVAKAADDADLPDPTALEPPASPPPQATGPARDAGKTPPQTTKGGAVPELGPNHFIYARDASQEVQRYAREDEIPPGSARVTDPKMLYELKRRDVPTGDYPMNAALARWCAANGVAGKAAAQARLAAGTSDPVVLEHALRTALIVRNVEVIEVLSRKGARVDAGRDIFARVERHRGLLRDLQDRIESADEKGPRAERVKILRQRIRFLEDDIRNRFETVTETESRKCGLCGGDGHVLIQTPDRKPDGPPGRKLERAQCERCEGTGYIRQNRIVRKRRDTGSQERELADQQESLVLAEKALAEYVKRLNDALARACQDLLEGRDPSVSAAVE